MLKRIWTLFIARNREFYRDRAGFGWNILFPFLIIVGFSFLFNQHGGDQYKVGIIGRAKADQQIEQHIEDFRKTELVELIEMPNLKEGIDKLKHHRIDLLIDCENRIYRINKTSPKGKVCEKIFLASNLNRKNLIMEKEEIKGKAEIPYIQWLFPGILAMNIMFSSLYGVGYTVVRYRKNGVLKRLSVTPLSSFEFLSSQVLSRLFVLFATTAIVYVSCSFIYGFENRGSYPLLILIFILGSLSMVSIALIIASRSSSEEFAGGVLNLISWPMMFLSEVWFSLEGANPTVKVISQFLPLSHITEGARLIINDGATFQEVGGHIMALSLMSIVFLTAGSLLFKWHREV